MGKNFNLMSGIGRAKYVINYHDGVKIHKDGSPFYDISIHSNKRKANKFCSELKSDGYRCSGISRF